MASLPKRRRGESDGSPSDLSRIESPLQTPRPKRLCREKSSSSVFSTTPNESSLPRRISSRRAQSPIPDDLVWGGAGIRTRLLKRLQPPDVERQDSPSEAKDDVIQMRKELRRLVDGLHGALRHLDYRRCLLILTYLLHARHLIRADVINRRRYGETIAALTHLSHPSVATCAKTLMQLWRYGLAIEKRSATRDRDF